MVNHQFLELLSLSNKSHFDCLRDAYDLVGNKTWAEEDFIDSSLGASRALFTDESLQSRRPTPKSLEVYALLSGLTFPEKFCSSLVGIQNSITDILADCLCYWVKPVNLGVEYCVFKWPEEHWDKKYFSIIDNFLQSVNEEPFNFHILGIQINPDGCVVAKGFDEGRQIFRLRERLKSEILFLPKRQSGWAHIPLGRILEPIGKDRFAKLKKLINVMSNQFICSTKILDMKFIHETRWYMEEREVLTQHLLISHSIGGVYETKP